MKLHYYLLTTLFFLLATVANSTGAAKDLLTDYEMSGESAAPSLTVLQQNEDGSNYVVEDVPEVYPAAVPYFLEYIQENMEGIDGLQGKAATAIAITYGYPDNLEINLLSDNVEKITRKIRPDEKLHGLRIRSAMVMFNFIEGEGGEDDSNVTVGFQLFPEDVEYAGMDIKPDYELKKGSWSIVWERSVRVYTRVYRTVRVVSTPGALIVQTITKVVRTVRASSRIVLVAPGGRTIVLAVRSWTSSKTVHTKVETEVIPKKTSCKCYRILPPPASPIDEDPTTEYILCGEPFYVQGETSCSERGKILYPECDYCR